MAKFRISVLCAGLFWCVAALAATPAPMSATQARAANAEAQAENRLIAQVQTAEAAKDWPKAVTLLEQLTTMDPARWQYRQALGDAEFNAGRYEDAAKSFTEALKGALKDKSHNTLAALYMSQGNAYLKLKRNDDALAAYQKAAENSDMPAAAYFNRCATEFVLGRMEAALSDCDKTLAADPNKADAWFIKGSLLLGNSTTDAAGKTVAPPGTAEALQMYLKLAPNGPHAADVREMLDFLNGGSTK